MLPEHSSWKEAELFLGTAALRLFALLKKGIITYLNPEIPGVFRSACQTSGREPRLRAPRGDCWPSGSNALAVTQRGRQHPQLQESTTPAPWATENRQGCLLRWGAGFGVGFPKGQVWTGAQLTLKSPAPASLLQNPPLLRFEKHFIVICWSCLGPVIPSTAGAERRGKDVLRS